MSLLSYSRSLRGRGPIAVAALASLLAVAACGGATSDESSGSAATEDVTIRLNWSYLGQHLGISAAKDSRSN